MTTTDFFIPQSVDEALALLHEHGPDLTILGGGTIIMGLINDGKLFPRKAMSLRRAQLDTIDQQNEHTRIGAATTVARLSQLGALPLLAEAAGLLGGPAIRTQATVGGNLFTPPPHADLATPLLALDAQAELSGAGGRRTLPLEQFFTGPAQTARAADELLTGLLIPPSGGSGVYMKYGRRKRNTPSITAVAARVITADDGSVSDARIALGASGPYPFRAHSAEAALIGRRLDAESIAQAAAAAMAESDPPTDALASAWYRRRMVGVFVTRALARLASTPAAQRALNAPRG